MLDRLIEFAANHYLLVSAFFLLWAGFFVLESRRGGKTLSPQLATSLVNKDQGVLVDLRAADDFRAGHIAGSLNLPSGELMDRLGELEKHKDKSLILVCDMGGGTASQAGRQLRAKGFTNLYRMQGGLNAWRNESLPLVKG
ncbi:rhodanese domain-containing protein [Alcanivorax hongdengensis A-11-3]|uniref:Rhodanese domain-containing protein n=1 Tax=Alcanivorax hongdengensis A-11-3 TaxID=1177179 RepID=L0WFE4_9GAMM|nr:rhodanese-like domain-containing protein [Alcanivorax hongdengensis]EKF75409.1 rhodanese domain-containing protein [Alcanivorax hongdengensis A-11-3]